MNRKKIVVNDPEKQDSRWHEYREIWINKWNLVCVKIVAFISFSFIIGLIIVKSVQQLEKSEEPKEPHYRRLPFTNNFEGHIKKSVPENDCTYSYEPEWGENHCKFTCYRINANDITEIIKVRYKENNCNRDTIILILEEVTFDGSIMKKGWWNINIYIKHLFIKSCYLMDIQEGALNKYFSSAVTITFSRSQIPYYRKNMFTGITRLSNFEIQDSNLALPPNQFEDPSSEGIKFEFGVLENFKNSLTTLQVQRSIKNPIAVRNLTGMELNKLLILDIRFNENLTYIPDGVFKTENLQKLHIAGNALTEFHDNAFKNAPGVSYIDLQNNNFKSLNENMIKSFKTHNTLLISNNNWDCSMNLCFLNMYNNIPDLENTKCSDHTPMSEILASCSSSIETTTKFVTTEKQPNSSTTKSSTSSSISLSTTTEFVTTEKQPESTSNKPSTSSSTSLSTTTITETTPSKTLQPNITSTTRINYVQEECHIISNQFRIENETVDEVAIAYNGIRKPGDSFILFTTGDPSCKFKNGVGKIRRAYSNTPYIMCKYNSEELDCFSGLSPARYEEQTWLKNNAKIPVILIGISITIAVGILTAIGVFCYVRKHPKLLRGNKRIKYFKGPNTDVVVLPKHRSPVYLSPCPEPYCRDVTYIPVREAPYLTPISQRYMQINDDRPNLKRSVSDLSMKTVASYVTENQLASYRRRSQRQNAERVLEEPPPLPPPLPPPRNRYEEVIVHEVDNIPRFRNTNYW